MLDKEKIAKENLEDNILVEVRSMKIVNHPYIVRLFELLKTNKKILLLMEYMDGGDLFDAIKCEKNSRMAEKKAKTYFQQIINAVQYLHTKNIIHRDLKPENILIDKKNNCIKITDFGLSALIKRKDEILPDIAGTTDYLAPEIIKQIGYLGQSADVWSCGVILYNLVTGNKPFGGRGSKMIHNIISGNVRYPSNLSKSLINLLNKMLDPDPTTRITIEQIINHEWFNDGYDIIVKNVSDYLISHNEDIRDYNISSRKNNLSLINTVYPSYKALTINFNEISLIDGFTLLILLYSHSVGDMFSNDNKNFNEEHCYKFICNRDVKFFCDIFNEFININKIESEYIKVEKNKMKINLVYKETNLSIFLEMFRLDNEKKMLYIFKFDNGINSDYKSFINKFFNKYKGDIQKL